MFPEAIVDWSVSLGSYTLLSTFQTRSLTLVLTLPLLPLLYFFLYLDCFSPYTKLPFSCIQLFILFVPPFSFLSFPAAGFPQSTHPSCRYGVTAIYGRWVRFPSIGVWTAWTRQGCWPRLNSAREMRATWEPWAPSARLVAPRGPCLSAVGPYTPCTLTAMSNEVVQGEEIPSVAVLRPELTIRSPSGKVWAVQNHPNLSISVQDCAVFCFLRWLQAYSDALLCSFCLSILCDVKWLKMAKNGLLNLASAI